MEPRIAACSSRSDGSTARRQILRPSNRLSYSERSTPRSLDEAGAIDAGHRYAADILAQFGGKSLVGTRIVFVSDRTGSKEIWVMNWDGTAQRQLTRYGSLSSFPSASPDGRIVAFTTYASGFPAIQMLSIDTGRKLPFYNQRASMNSFVTFTPDSKRVIFSSTAGGGPAQLYMANVDGSDFHRITASGGIEVEAKINPKTGADLVDVSGRGGMPQIYQMTSGRNGCPANQRGNGRSNKSILESRWSTYRVCLDQGFRARQLQHLRDGCSLPANHPTYRK